ncbi:MAG: acyltransferase family protein [Usitatibacteraceae bacterium]
MQMQTRPAVTLPPGAALEPPSVRRLTQVDGLRAIAALLVLSFHWTTQYENLFMRAAQIWPQFSLGYFGVNLFFVISGFVISMTLDRSRTPADFVVSRFARLFPAYWASVAITSVLLLVLNLPGYQASFLQTLANFSMFQSFFSIPDIDGVYWSLQVELIFYMWMLALWSIGLFKHLLICVTFWTGISLAASLLNNALGIRIPFTLEHMLLLTWIPWFAMGIAVYSAHKCGRITAPQALLLVVSLASIATQGDWIKNVVALISVSAVFLASHGRLWICGVKPLVFLGVISYPLYLIHEKIGWLLIKLGESLALSNWLVISLAFATCIASAALIHAYVERPGAKKIKLTTRDYLQKRVGADAKKFNRPVWVASVAGLILALTLAMSFTLSANQAKEKKRFSLDTNSLAARAKPCSENWLHDAAFVIVVLGQSNAGSHATSSNGDDTIRVLSQARCFQTGDPLPQTSGSGSSIWTSLAKVYVEDDPTTSVVFAPLAIGNTRIGDWLPDGRIWPQFRLHLDQIKQSGIPVRAVLWQQGEADSLAGTPAIQYKRALLSLRQTLDAENILAPMFVAKSTYCRNGFSPFLHRAIEQAAREAEGMFVGPNTDELQGNFRSDGCHFNALGRVEAARMWMMTLRSQGK